MKYKYIAIDFDGTIVDEAFPNIGQVKPHAKRVMQKIQQYGGVITIWTCRTGIDETNCIDFLTDNGIPFDYFNCNPQELIDRYGTIPRKLGADIYIDDKTMFYNIDWLEIEKELFGDK